MFNYVRSWQDFYTSPSPCPRHRVIGDEKDEESRYKSWIYFSFRRINQFLLEFCRLIRDESGGPILIHPGCKMLLIDYNCKEFYLLILSYFLKLLQIVGGQNSSLFAVVICMRCSVSNATKSLPPNIRESDHSFK